MEHYAYLLTALSLLGLARAILAGPVLARGIAAIHAAQDDHHGAHRVHTALRLTGLTEHFGFYYCVRRKVSAIKI